MENLFEIQVKPKALAALKRAKMPDSPGAVQKMTNFYLDQLKGKKNATNEKGEVLVVDDSGNPIENKHGWPMTAQDAVDQTFSQFFVDNGLPHTVDKAYRRLSDPGITSDERIRITNYINVR